MSEIKKEPMMKGAGVISVVTYLRQHRAAARKLLPKEMHWYLKRRLLVSSWFPEADFLTLLRALCDLLDTPEPLAQLRVLAHQRAPHDLGSYYRTMVQPGDPRSTVKLFGGLWKLYHDTGRMAVTVDGDHKASVALRDFPWLSRELCAVTEGHYLGALAGAGATRGRIEMTHFDTTQGACDWLVTW